MIKDLRKIYMYCEGDITKIENFDKAILDRSDLNTHSNWVCHHRLETHNIDGSRREIQISADDLKALGLYYHRPASELIFLTREDHNKVHTCGRKSSFTQVEFLTSKRQIPVRCIELNKTFPSIKDAAKYLNVNSAGLCSTLRGQQKLCKGYHWEYALTEDELKELRRNIHPVQQYYKRSDGVVKDAIDWKTEGFLQTSICTAIHKHKPYKGYYWEVQSFE